MKFAGGFWHGLSIKRKLMLFFSLIIIFISFLNFYILVNAFRYLKIYELDLIKNTLVYELGDTLSDNSKSLEEYLMYSSKASLSRYMESIPEVWDKWNRVWEYCNTNKDLYFQISAIRYAFLAYIESAGRAISHKGVNDDVFVESLFYARRINGYMDSYLRNLVQLRLEEGSRLHSVQISRVRFVRVISFIGIIVFGIISLIFVHFFSNSVTKPLRELASMSLKVAQGELAIPEYSIPNRDEIGILAESFNKMTSNIERMVNRLKDKVEIERKLREDELKIAEMSRSLKEARFLSLQSQISPHFLFNTLNTISRTSLFEKAPRTVTLIEALSNILRYTLNNQNRFVTLEEEINILVRYMHIQKTRYGDRLRFVLDRSGIEEKVRIPIFTIQPLVENAVKYGIEPSENGGTVTVSVEDAGDYVVVGVRDTGAGMSEEMVKRIMENADPGSGASSTGIGLSNVRRRLYIAFQGKGTFRIKSRPGEGTFIMIQIPRGQDVQNSYS